jgi:hypothetical protein
MAVPFVYVLLHGMAGSHGIHTEYSHPRACCSKHTLGRKETNPMPARDTSVHTRVQTAGGMALMA